MSKALHIRDLQPGYGGTAIFTVEQAELESGTLTALIGRNGSGKSTLLRTLAGLISPVSGKVFLGDAELPSRSGAERAKIVSSVFHGAGSGMGMTVYEMIALGRNPHTGWWGKLSEEDEAQIQNAAEQTGVSKLLDKRISETSDGERQKCMIARSLAQNTPILLLDEPLAFLDFQAKLEMLELLRSLSKQGKVILFSTHDLELSLPKCDKVWAIDESKAFNELELDDTEDWKEKISELYSYSLK